MTSNHPNGDGIQTSSSRVRTEAAPRSSVEDAIQLLQRRDPEDMLGAPNDGGLMRAFLQAAVGMAILFAALTVIPYYIDKGDKKETPEPEKKEGPASSTEAPKETPAPTSSPESPATALKKNPEQLGDPKLAKKKDLPDLLGETGTKKANPKINPLDSAVDDLFKDSK